MKKISISDTEIDALAAWIEEHAEHIHIDRPEDSNPPAVKVIHCVLSLNRNYHSFVLPRLEAFVEKHPETRTVHELACLIASFPTPDTFMQQELNYNYEELAYTLQSVVEFVCKIVENEPKVLEKVVLKNWAIQAKPEEYQTLNIRRFGIAGFQYLRMLFGADTVKPDIHVRRYVSKIIDRNVSDNELILLLEAASKQANHSVRAVDRYIWDLGARYRKIDESPQLNDELRPEFDETLQKNGIRGKYAEQYAAGTNVVLLDPDVAAAFPNDKVVNDALRFMLKVLDDAKHLNIQHKHLIQAQANSHNKLSVHHIARTAIDLQTEKKIDVGYSEFWAPIRNGEYGELFKGKPVPLSNEGWTGKNINNIGVLLFITNQRCYVQLYFRGENPLERRDSVMELFPESDYSYDYNDSPKQIRVQFPVLNKGKNDREDWDEIREKLVEMGTDIYNKINESGL